jgi:hypothetical protein
MKYPGMSRRASARHFRMTRGGAATGKAGQADRVCKPTVPLIHAVDLGF